ncbi:MAG: hypothetical protein SPI77_01260 [Corynebacterium sp.]|nr:hypothetical protein [Corynebacterium sp.]
MDLSAVKDALDFFHVLVKNLIGLFTDFPKLLLHIGELAKDGTTLDSDQDPKTYFDFDTIQKAIDAKKDLAPEEPAV